MLGSGWKGAGMSRKRYRPKDDLRRPAPSGSPTEVTAESLFYTILQPFCTPCGTTLELGEHPATRLRWLGAVDSFRTLPSNPPDSTIVAE